MTDTPDTDPVRPPDEEETPDLRLRGRPPRVVRLSRKALAVMGAVAGVSIGGILIYALQASTPPAPPELYQAQGRAGAGALANAPRDYAAAPRLGPPLPGDLGGPILDAQQRGVDVQPPTTAAPGDTAADQARARAQQERDAARISQLFMASATGRGGLSGDGAPSLGALGLLQGITSPLPAPGAAPVGEGRGGFLDSAPNRETTSAERLQPPVSPHIIQAGNIIPAALITGIRSDLPGQVTAQVTTHVYDSLTGRILLIPQGARLIGAYESEMSFGQQRLLLAWERLILPDGRSIVLERQPAADPSGYAGLQDRVDNHWGAMMRAALISTVLGIGAELGADNDDDLVRALRRGTQDTINQAGQQVVQRQLNVRPTLTIRPGHPLRVMVTRDLVLEPIRTAR